MPLGPAICELIWAASEHLLNHISMRVSAAPEQETLVEPVALNPSTNHITSTCL